MINVRVLSTTFLGVCLLLLFPAASRAQSPAIAGRVVDETGTALPGVAVELRMQSEAVRETVTDADGRFRFDVVEIGPARVTFSLVQFASSRRVVVVPDSATLRLDAVMRLALGADVTVTGKSTFTNLADVENPTQSLVGIAQSASQGAIGQPEVRRRDRAVGRHRAVRERRPRLSQQRRAGRDHHRRSGNG